MDFDVFRAFVGLMVVLVGLVIVLAWISFSRREKPLETGITFIVDDGQVVSLFFDRRGHLVRTVIRDPLDSSS